MYKVTICFIDKEKEVIPNVKDIENDDGKTILLVVDDEAKTEIILPLNNVRYILAADE